MFIQGKPYTSIWYDQITKKIYYIDQNQLPDKLMIKELQTIQDAIRAIRVMEVRGAPLIGVAAAFGIATASGPLPKKWEDLKGVAELLAARPTAVNLRWAVERMQKVWERDWTSDREMTGALWKEALCIRQEEIDRCRMIGENGVKLIEEVYQQTRRPVNIMTHCNAGWLACVDWGTATAPVYVAQERGIPVHVWVSETRPRNQGTRLTMFELQEQGIPSTLIVDSAAGHLMQQGKVDLVLVGADRIARNGDIANKIGTYLKALSAKDNQVPFWVAAPSSSFDNRIATGHEIPIEERDPAEVLGNNDKTKKWQAVNPAFDITPAELVTGYVTEKG
ncbi:MAG: S-methyl-5-thioribose-1-phosphate isomerase [Bacteroidales bacterium]|nr:S-methyl-5-thioribose-1-phosphate isomerase [Bacteroidales bacterium]